MQISRYKLRAHLLRVTSNVWSLNCARALALDIFYRSCHLPNNLLLVRLTAFFEQLREASHRLEPVLDAPFFFACLTPALALLRLSTHPNAGYVSLQ